MNCTINKDLLIIKLLYFFQLSVAACLFMYLTPVMYEFGITATELAIINFVAHFSSLFARPSFGYLADKYQKYKQIIVISASICTTLTMLRLAIPKHYTYLLNTTIPNNYFLIQNQTNVFKLLLCHANSSTVRCWPSLLTDCSLNSSAIVIDHAILISSNIYCSNFHVFGLNSAPKINILTNPCVNILQNCSISQRSVLTERYHGEGMTWSITFWLSLFLESICHSLLSSINGLTDSLTFIILDQDKSHKFGFTRVFGTIGVLLFSIITALLLYGFDWSHQNRQWKWNNDLMSITQYMPCFLMGFILFLGVIVTGLFLKNKKPMRTEPFWKCLSSLFRNLEISIFLLFSICGGFTFSVLMEYYFIIMPQMFIGLPKYFPGLVFSVMTISEMVFMASSPIFLKFMNDEFWISIAFCVWAIKWMSYLFVTNYWLLILIELLNGPAFGLMLPCMMSYISKFGNKATQGRIQSLFSSLFYNIGGALGSLFGGLMLDKFGYRGIFITMTLFCLFCGILYYPIQKLVVQRFCNKRNEYFTYETEVLMQDFVKREVYI